MYTSNDLNRHDIHNALLNILNNLISLYRIDDEKHSNGCSLEVDVHT